MPRESLPTAVAKSLKRSLELAGDHSPVVKDFSRVSRHFGSSYVPATPANVLSAWKEMEAVLPGEPPHGSTNMHLRRFGIGNIIIHSLLRDHGFNASERKAVAEALTRASNNDYAAATSVIKAARIDSSRLNIVSNSSASFAKSFTAKFNHLYNKNAGAVPDVNNAVNALSGFLELISFKMQRPY